VLADYKESEKIPGEIASCLKLIARETNAMPIHNPKANGETSMPAISALSHTVLKWIKFDSAIQELLRVYEHTPVQGVLTTGWLNDSPLEARLMTEPSILLRSIHRIHVIRKTEFVPMVS